MEIVFLNVSWRELVMNGCLVKQEESILIENIYLIPDVILLVALYRS